MRRRSILALLAAASCAVALGGCGGGDDSAEGTASPAGEPTPTPVIESAVLEGEKVKVAYSAPGSGAKEPLQLLLSVDDTDDESGPLTEAISPVPDHGEVTMEFDVDSTSDEVLASIIYADGSRSDVTHFPLETP